MIHPKAQRFMADRMHATVRSHPVDHTPIYSAPTPSSRSSWKPHARLFLSEASFMETQIGRCCYGRQPGYRASHGAAAGARFLGRWCWLREMTDVWSGLRARFESIGAECAVYALDLRQPQAAETVVKGTLDRFGRIDALLNIAGAVPQIDLFEMTDAQWDDGMALKLHGARRLTIRAWDALKASKGSVVLMSGSAALDPKPGFAAVAATMRRSSRLPRRSQSKESKTECRSIASCRAR